MREVIVGEVGIWAQYTQHPMKFLLPTSCIGCKKFQTNSICDKCLNILKCNRIHRCQQCAIPSLANQTICRSCQINPPAFDSTLCLDGYGGLLTESLHDYKYHGKIALAKCFANTWQSVFNATPSFQTNINWMIPVPLSLQKLHNRGFNQSWELCKILSKSYRINSDAFVLGRNHMEGSQADANREQRLTRLINTFKVNPKSLNRIDNKNILIVDDVMTTGATLNVMAKVLKDFGAQSVHNWVILRTPL
jgi:ComF family protein